jgi:hypothetical protein
MSILPSLSLVIAVSCHYEFNTGRPPPRSEWNCHREKRSNVATSIL